MYHGCLAMAASWYYGRPSEKMIVIGITGTAGKVYHHRHAGGHIERGR